MEYILISDTDPDVLAKKVNDSIKNGYVPAGGLACFVQPLLYKFFQAMIKTKGTQTE